MNQTQRKMVGTTATMLRIAALMDENAGAKDVLSLMQFGAQFLSDQEYYDVTVGEVQNELEAKLMEIHSAVFSEEVLKATAKLETALFYMYRSGLSSEEVAGFTNWVMGLDFSDLLVRIKEDNWEEE